MGGPASQKDSRANPQHREKSAQAIEVFPAQKYGERGMRPLGLKDFQNLWKYFSMK